MRNDLPVTGLVNKRLKKSIYCTLPAVSERPALFDFIERSAVLTEVLGPAQAELLRDGAGSWLRHLRHLEPPPATNLPRAVRVVSPLAG